MLFKSVLGTIAACMCISSLSSHGALIGRDLDGDNTTAEAYYSTDQDISWLANADGNGATDWDTQIAWAAALVVGSATNWRLPTSDVNGDNDIQNCWLGTNPNCIDNELGYLYWDIGITPDAPGPFNNVQAGSYWSSTEFGGTGGTSAYFTNFNNGNTSVHGKASLDYAWAVHDGMVGDAVIPIPAAIWLFGSGLLGLIGLARRKA